MKRASKALIRALCTLMFITVALIPYASVRAHTSTTSPVEWACWPDDWTPWCRDDDSDAALYQITMIDANDGWAVGTAGMMLRWDGAQWKVHEPSITGETLTSVAMASADMGWAVGTAGTILRWDGRSWAPQESPTENQLSSVTAVSTTDAWAVGAKGTIIHWDGSEWTSFESPTEQSLLSIAMVSGSDGWAVGGLGQSFAGMVRLGACTGPACRHTTGSI